MQVPITDCFDWSTDIIGQTYNLLVLSDHTETQVVFNLIVTFSMKSFVMHNPRNHYTLLVGTSTLACSLHLSAILGVFVSTM